MSLEEDLMQDAQEDALAIAYIKNHLPQELQEKMSEDTLYYFLDLTYDYYVESGILDAEPDQDGYIEIDEEAIAEHLSKKAKKEGIGNYTAEELLFFVQAQTDFEEEATDLK